MDHITDIQHYNASSNLVHCVAEVNVERFQKPNCDVVPAVQVFTQFLLSEVHLQERAASYMPPMMMYLRQCTLRYTQTQCSAPCATSPTTAVSACSALCCLTRSWGLPSLSCKPPIKPCPTGEHPHGPYTSRWSAAAPFLPLRSAIGTLFGPMEIDKNVAGPSPCWDCGHAQPSTSGQRYILSNIWSPATVLVLSWNFKHAPMMILNLTLVLMLVTASPWHTHNRPMTYLHSPMDTP